MEITNPLLQTDGYKLSHAPQYPQGTQYIYSYLESRGGKFPATLFFELQYILKRYLCGKIVTQDRINEAYEFSKVYFGKDYFNKAGWEYILKTYNGCMPLEIKAVKEGEVIPVGNVLMTIVNTDPNCFWLTNFVETLILKIWYGITVSSNSFFCKKTIKQYLEETGGDISTLPFKLVDFGSRGVSSCESAGIGGMSHLVNFMVSDTLEGILYANKYYNSGICGFSIPASEHSTITSWGRENELAAYQNMLKQYPTGLAACVVDSYDAFNACDKLFGVDLHDEIMKRDGTFILRPDSGHPPEIISRIIDILWNRFGGDYTTKGFKVLTPKVRIIQGDGIDYEMIGEILLMMKNKGFSADNIAFGSGGGLLQKFDRDTQKFAIKCSHAIINGKGVDVYKDPITSSGKKSKKGLLKLHRSGNSFMTLSSATETPEMFNSYIDELQTVFLNGELVKEYSFDEIRKTSEKYL